MESSPTRIEPFALAIVAAIALGVALACAAMPFVYRNVPSDLARVGTIARALRDERPRVVVLGDSRAEAAVDARLLGEGAMNFAAADQSLAEMLVLAERLPSSVEVVLVFVTPEDLGSSWIGSPESGNALWMHGLRGSPATRGVYERCFGATLHANGELRERFAARWTLRQALESALRTRIRRSLLLERERNDLYFPSIYAETLSEARLKLDVEETRGRAVGGGMQDGKVCALNALAAVTQRGGRRLVLVIPPIHPGALPPGYDPWRRKLASFAREQRIALSDQTDAVPAEAFADARHLSHAGARAFTPMLRTLAD